jgi:acyl-CoA synthetase (NDP forming)
MRLFPFPVRKVSESHAEKTGTLCPQRGQKAKSESLDIIKKARSEGRRYLLETEAKKIIAIHKAPVVEEKIAVDAEQAVKLAKKPAGRLY